MLVAAAAASSEAGGVRGTLPEGMVDDEVLDGGGGLPAAEAGVVVVFFSVGGTAAGFERSGPGFFASAKDLCTSKVPALARQSPRFCLQGKASGLGEAERCPRDTRCHDGEATHLAQHARRRDSSSWGLPLAAGGGGKGPAAEHPHGSDGCPQHEGSQWPGRTRMAVAAGLVTKRRGRLVKGIIPAAGCFWRRRY